MKTKVLSLLAIVYFSVASVFAQDDPKCYAKGEWIILTGVPNIINFYGKYIQFAGDTGNTVVSYSWDFGDEQTSAEKNPIHRYAMGGDSIFKVKFTAKSETCSATDSFKVAFGGVAITECISAFQWYFDNTIMLFAPGYPIRFKDISRSSDGDIVKWEWDFGDGYTSTEQNPLHIYNNYPLKPAAASYIVTLKTTSANGCESKYSEEIILKQKPECLAYFKYELPTDIVSIPELIPVQFYDASEGDVVERKWFFSDSSVSTEKAPLHSFNFMEEYPYVSLTIRTASGCENTYFQYIDLHPNQTKCSTYFDYYETDSVVTIPEVKAFQFIETTSSTNIAKRFWDFGDGSTSYENNPIHSFLREGGQFLVTLTTSTVDGCVSSYSNYVYTSEPKEKDTCAYYINIATQNNTKDSICDGKASANVFDYNGNEIKNTGFTWSNGEMGNTASNLCANTLYTVKTNTENGCYLFSNFALYTKIIDSCIYVDPIDWNIYKDSTNWYFNYPAADSGKYVYRWNFGDGTIVEGNNVNHSFETAGTYKITLTIIDENGSRNVVTDLKVANTTEIEIPAKNNTISVFPNPVTDELNIKLFSEKNTNTKIDIYNINGQLQESKTVNYQGENLSKINVRNLQSGVYVVKISTEGKSTISKFIK